MRFHTAAEGGLAMAAIAIAFGPALIFGQDVHAQANARDVSYNVNHERSFDTFQVFNRKRKAHACIMSTVFLVLYPLGAISLHLPLQHVPYLKNVRKVTSIHVPIQILGFVLMIGGMALGIRVGHDLGYLEDPVHSHVTVGLLNVCFIVVFQPIMGILQHRHFKKTGKKSIFAYLHRWTGRGAIALGMINNGLGFQLTGVGTIVPRHFLVLNFTILGVLTAIWFGLVVFDEFNGRRQRKMTTAEEKGMARQDTKDPSGAETNRDGVILLRNGNDEPVARGTVDESRKNKGA